NAIAKGYIADRVKVFLTDRGVEHALIDLGRNILLIGGKPDGSDFRIGVQDPFDPEEASARYVLKAAGKSVVTSGVYERYFEYEGVRYHHILDPFTGFPADRGVVSATIVSDDSAQGDALSTTCLLLGPEAGLAVIESVPGVEALLIGADGQEWFSSGFKAYLAD
ncbi:MAG: FAD:protein FMN transferase, partial [Oscillospiraceae bacterium]